MQAAVVTDHLKWNESLWWSQPTINNCSHVRIYTRRLLTHTHIDMKEHTCSSTHTCDNRCTKTHTGEMSDARPSGPQTAVCHKNHRRVTWTQSDKTTMEQEKTKGKGLTEIKVREQKRVLAWKIFSLGLKAYFNLSLKSFHTAGAQTLSLFFPPPFVLSLFYHFFPFYCWPPLFPCSQMLRPCWKRRK